MTLLGFCKGWYTFLQLCFSAVSLFPIGFPFVYLRCTSWELLVLFWSIYCFLSVNIYIYICIYLVRSLVWPGHSSLSHSFPALFDLAVNKYEIVAEVLDQTAGSGSWKVNFSSL